MRRILNILFHTEWKTPLHKAEALLAKLSPVELVVFIAASIVFVASSFVAVYKVRDQLSVEVPAHGGTLVEGVLGTPRFVNPLLSVSDGDRDLSALLYAGLVRMLPQGTIVPELAESYTISDDGMSYTFNLREDAVWSDGKSVTADDVEFTILRAQDPAQKSPRRAAWEGVTVEKTSPQTIVFHLKQPYGFFLDNATIGIMPKHIWSSLSADEFPFSESNIYPVGSGPFIVDEVIRNGNGVPSQYRLIANKKYVLEKPYLDSITVRFYQNETLLKDALLSGEVESASGISPTLAKEVTGDNHTIVRAPLSRTFGVFFNHNQAAIFADKPIRSVLSKTIDRNAIISEVLGGFGTPITNPVVNSSFPIEILDIDAASSTLAKSGYTIDEEGTLVKKTKKDTTKITFSLASPNVPELVVTARMIADTWKKLGILVDVKIFEAADLQQNIIRPRKYDALLFGMATGREPDFYAFWHSSQRNDPGSNVSMYTNAKADKALEAIRQSEHIEERAIQYKAFAQEIETDVPAALLYSPDFLYLIPKNLKGVTVGTVSVPSDRFALVTQWYTKTDKVWSIFKERDDNTSTQN